MKRIITLVLGLVITSLIILSDNPKSQFSKIIDNTNISDPIKNENWEYIKDKLFSGEGEGEFVYKLDRVYNNNNPILITLNSATTKDSIAVNEVIEELRMLIPNRTIDYYKNFVGKSFEESKQDWEAIMRDVDVGYSTPEPIIKGITYEELDFCTIRLSFSIENDATVSDAVIATLLPDGSRIERTNAPRRESFTVPPSKVWLHLKETLSNTKIKQYIQYELLRTLCYVYPNMSNQRSNYVQTGVFSTPYYIPDSADFNHLDKFLLKKLYEDDFIDQFKTYLFTKYSWRYGSNYLNKTLTKTIAWAVVICIALTAFLLLFSFFQSKKFRKSYLNYFLPMLFILLYHINCALVYTYITSNALRLISEMDILFIYLVVSLTALISSFILWIVEKLWADKINNFVLKLATKVILTFSVFNLPAILLFIVKGSETEGFAQFYLPTFIFTIILAIARGLLIYLNHFSDNLVKQKDVELSHLKEVNAQSELKLLQSHINPHFLYNALNSIASLAPIDTDKTQKMAYSLANLFKYSFNRKDEKMGTISDEIAMIENYLEIEKIRFGKRLQFTIAIDEGLEEEEIPMFLIQPLIENAIKHGLSKIEGKGIIALKIIKVSDGIEISVTDNGPDFPEGLVSGHGLQTVYDLLRLSYGDHASLHWQNSPKKTITIHITKLYANPFNNLIKT